MRMQVLREICPKKAERAMGRLNVLTERYKSQKGNDDLPVKIVVSFLASQKGFEPPTLRLGGARSIQLSY